MKAMERIVSTLPDWMRSARFRIAVTYSTVLFFLAGAAVLTLYLVVLNTVHADPEMRRPILVPIADRNGDGEVSGPDEIAVIGTARQTIRLVNEQALEKLKKYALIAVGGLFLVSLGVGWVIAGRVLRPINRITDVANDIQATDLSRRIQLEGPPDDLKRLADTFDRMLERLEKAFAMQRGFIADASHELRNPLAIIKTNLDVVLADPRASDDELRKTAAVVRRATERMSRIVDDLFALARLESRGAVRETVQLAPMAAEVMEEFKALAAQNYVALVSDLSPVTVQGDEAALKRATANLVDNAIRYAPQGSDVTLGAGRRDGWAWLAVKDRGPGIPAEHHERVFDRFWRAERSSSHERAGSGLGLAIVREIARAHGGIVRLHSTPGVGSTFVIWIPEAERRRGVPSAAPDLRPLAATPA